MAKKLKNSWWLRSCFALMSCAVIVACCVVPARAYLIDPDGTPNMQTILSGDLTLNYSLVNNEDFFSTSKTYPVGGVMPFIEKTGDSLYGENYDDFLLSKYNSPDWNLETIFRLARYKRSLQDLTGQTYNFDKFRYNISAFEHGDFYDGAASYSSAVFEFDPYYFESYNPLIFSALMGLRLTTPCDVTVSGYICTYAKGSNGLMRYAFSFTTKGVGNSNIELFYPFLEPAADAVLKVFDGFPCLLEDLTVTVKSSDGSFLTGLSFELLGEQWATVSPRYVRPDNDSVAQFMKYLNNSIVRSPIPDGNTFTTWLGGVVAGFFDVELIPGFSFGTMFGVVMAVTIAVIVLKLMRR